jgi:hypothetical protein
MADDKESKDARLEELTAQVKALTAMVDQMSHQSEQPKAAVARPQKVMAAEEPEEISEEILTWAGQTHILSRISTLCFLLVFALILRTITDNNLINTLLGSALGMGYAAILILVGWYKYAKESPLAPIFAACGAALMAIIVLETHTKFQSLPLVPAYFTLMATGIVMAVISYRFNALVPISVGTLGMCLAGAAIDYPNPFFPYLCMILWTANILGFFAARIRRCSWLRWIVLLVTMMMLFLWSIRLAIPHSRHELPLEFLAPEWFMPVLGLFAATFLALALAGIIRSGSEQIARFDYTLPTVNVIWAFSTASYMINATEGSRALLGGIGVLAAAGHLGVGYWLVSRGVNRAPGTNAFAFAGSALLALALPPLVGSTLGTLPFLSIMAVVMSILADKWVSGGVRFTSYSLQLYTAIVLAICLRGAIEPASAVIGAVAAAVVTAASIYHYRWCRRTPPPATSQVFFNYDRKDRSAVFLLLGGLSSAFFLLRIVVHKAIGLLPGDPANTFRCSQSVIINVAAAILMLLAFFRKDKELRNVAVFITTIGAMKVFIYDMLGTKGVPLVLSVLSFGLAAALESILLSRWKSDKGENFQ